MFGKLEPQEMENVLSSQYLGRLGCYLDGRVYVVPISYAYDGLYIYAHSHEGMKVQMMRNNPDVCFQADVMENMASWRSVICWGTFEEVTNKEERAEALKSCLPANCRLLPAKW